MNGKSAGDGPSRVLLIGGAGQLGTALAGELRERDVVAPSHDALDLAGSGLEDALDDVRPQVAINCAAFHNVDACETTPERAFAVNAAAVGRLADLCAQRGIAFVTVSTDYVFDGTASQPYAEDDRPNPRTAYGISKLAGELFALRWGATVVRTSGLFGLLGTSSKGYTLVDRVLAQARRGEKTRMVDDVVFSPSFAPHVARAMRELVDRGASGIHHVTNGGSCSWYEFVAYAFRLAGLGDAELEPVSYRELGNPTPRPLYSPLRNTTFDGLGIEPLPAWQDAVAAYLERVSPAARDETPRRVAG